MLRSSTTSSGQAYWLLLLALVAVLAAPGVAHAGSLEPTPAQLEAYGNIDSRQPVVFLKAFRIRDPEAHAAFLAKEAELVVEEEGRRLYEGRLEGADSSLEGTGFHSLVVDWFPDRTEALIAYNRTRKEYPGAHEDVRLLVVEPGPWYTRLLRYLGAVVHAVAGVEVDEDDPLAVPEELAAGDGSESLRLLYGPHEREALTVLNLNAYRERAAYPEGTAPELADASGAEAYGRYGRPTIPMILRRGGYPLISGRPEMLLIGPEDGIWATSWDELVLVSYPSRLHIRDMLARPEYQENLFHRDAGITRALVIPGTPAPAFDPKQR